jgi:predicted transcriptional regulator
MGVERRRRQRTRVSGNHVALVTRELGALIREERRKLNMGQEELAAAAGVSQPALSYPKNGNGGVGHS